MAKSSSSSKSLCLLSGAARASKPDPAAGPRTVNNAVRRRVHGYGPQERARRQRGGALFLLKLTDSILCWLCRLHKSAVLCSAPTPLVRPLSSIAAQRHVYMHHRPGRAWTTAVSCRPRMTPVRRGAKCILRAYNP